MTTEATQIPDAETLRAGLAAIINEISGVKAEKVTLEASFAEDLGLDSLTMIEVVTAAEDQFGRRIDDDDAMNLHTVADAVAYIQQAALR